MGNGGCISLLDLGVVGGGAACMLILGAVEVLKLIPPAVDGTAVDGADVAAVDGADVAGVVGVGCALPVDCVGVVCADNVADVGDVGGVVCGEECMLVYEAIGVLEPIPPAPGDIAVFPGEPCVPG